MDVVVIVVVVVIAVVNAVVMTWSTRGLAKLCYRRGAKMMAISKRGETVGKAQFQGLVQRWDIQEGGGYEVRRRPWLILGL